MARILVVDDEKPLQEVLARRLRGWGHEVRTVSSAVEAMEQLKVAPVDIVFSDVIMPEHDGIWLTEQIAKNWPDTIVIIVSGSQDADTPSKTRAAGAADYVPKPIRSDALYHALERAIASIEIRAQLARDSARRLD